MELIRLFRLSCLDQERLQKGLQVRVQWPQVIFNGGPGEHWIRETDGWVMPFCIVMTTNGLTGSPLPCNKDYTRILSIDIAPSSFSHDVKRGPNLVVIMALLKTWMPWLIERLLLRVPDLAHDVDTMWSESPLACINSNDPIIDHFLGAGKEHGKVDSWWLLHMICYAVVHSWWNGFSPNALHQLTYCHDCVPDGDFWPCDSVFVPDIYVVVYPSVGTMRFCFQNLCHILTSCVFMNPKRKNSCQCSRVCAALRRPSERNVCIAS